MPQCRLLKFMSTFPEITNFISFDTLGAYNIFHGRFVLIMDLHMWFENFRSGQTRVI